MVVNAPVRVLVITGSMGAGKTTVMAEASDVLVERGIAHAAIDLDALGIAYIAESADIRDAPRSDGMPAILLILMYRNLRSVWENYALAGVNRLLLARAIDRAELALLHEALDGAEFAICRLRAPLAVMEERVRVREPGVFQEKGVKRVCKLEALLDTAAVEDFIVKNGGRSITEVAHEMLSLAGWL